jgi:LPXTG-site transpeptidase (sortase) family protein
VLVLVSILGLLLIIVGVWLLTRPHANLKKQTPVIVDAAPFPSTGSLPAGMRIKVSELGIDLPVVEGDGWTVPLNVAAHYPGMKLPGDGDRSLVYAHAREGMFGALLNRGATGQHVEFDRPGKGALRYVIVDYKRVPSGDGQWLKEIGKEQLVLLTCTSYNANDPRIIAVAEPA